MIQRTVTHTAPRGSDGEVSTIKQISRTVTIFCCFVNNLGRHIYKSKIQSNAFSYASLNLYNVLDVIISSAQRMGFGGPKWKQRNPVSGKRNIFQSKWSNDLVCSSHMPGPQEQPYNPVVPPFPHCQSAQFKSVVCPVDTWLAAAAQK